MTIVDIYNADKEWIANKIQNWIWCILWVNDENWKHAIARWINLQSYKNLLVLYVDDMFAEELNQTIWRVERLNDWFKRWNIWDDSQKEIVLVKHSNINSEELMWYIKKIKSQWNVFLWEKSIQDYIDIIKDKANNWLDNWFKWFTNKISIINWIINATDSKKFKQTEFMQKW